MSSDSTAEFFRLMNEANERIAAAEAKKNEPDLDQVRLQKDAERRERYGQLRAREHTGKRPKQVRPIFGHVDLL